MHVEGMGGGAWKRRSVIIAAAVALHCALVVAPATAQVCVGDCGGKGSVGISDLVLGVNIALGNEPVSQCPEFDANTDGKVEINELVAAVNNALVGGCSPAKPPTQPAATHTASGATPTRPGATPTAPPGTATAAAATPTGPGATATRTIAAERFVDNHDGTITDLRTGLTWEKKVGLNGAPDLNNLHNAVNAYSWAGQCTSGSPTPARCQPTATPAAACVADAEGDRSACATCQAGQGTCADPKGGALTTVWDWVGQLNAGAGFAGHSDWRVPTESELTTTLDFTASTVPTVDRAFNGGSCGPGCSDATNPACSCTSVFSVSASTNKSRSDQVWSISYSGAVASTFVAAVDHSYVRAVRGGPAAMPRFEDPGDGTVLDMQTGLSWEKKVSRDGIANPSNLQDADNVYAWAGTCASNPGQPCQPTADAAAACAAGVEGNAAFCAQCGDGDTCSAADTIWTWLVALNAADFAGHSDWRLATAEDLASIIAYGAASPAVDLAFQGVSCGMIMCKDVKAAQCSCTRAGTYWSATISGQGAGNPWEIDFGPGRVDMSSKATSVDSVRAVRGGQ